MTAYFNFLYIVIIGHVFANGQIFGTWTDDFSCNSLDDEDDSKWSNCEIIDNNTIPLYHGPYSYNSSYDTLSRSFQCKYNSNISLSFYAHADCFVKSKDSLTVSLHNNHEYAINISNDSTCDDSWTQQYFNFSNIYVGSTKFPLTFDMDSTDGSILLSGIQLNCLYFPQNRKTLVLGLSWSSFASVVYFTLYALLVSGIAIMVARKDEYDGMKMFFKTVWRMRSIYGAVLVHLYDTATDIGVMIEWWFLAQDEARGYNYESIDMKSLFWASVGCLILYRVIGIMMVLKSERRSRKHLLSYCWSVVLAVFDMFILRAVWAAVDDGDTEPKPKQRFIQFMESICESLPQVLFQTVFIIRGYNDPNLKKNSSVSLVVLSLIASVLSITSKYIYFDRDQYEDGWKEAQFKINLVFINYRFILRVLYRFAMVIVRLISLSLVWVILGGLILPIYVALTWIYWFFFTLIAETKRETGFCSLSAYCDYYYLKQNPMKWLLTTTFALVSNLLGQGYGVQVGRLIENTILLSILTIFAFNDEINCGICADSLRRQATKNQYIFMFIISGWVLFIIETILGFSIGAMKGLRFSAAFGALKEIEDALDNKL